MSCVKTAQFSHCLLKIECVKEKVFVRTWTLFFWNAVISTSAIYQQYDRENQRWTNIFLKIEDKAIYDYVERISEQKLIVLMKWHMVFLAQKCRLFEGKGAQSYSKQERTHLHTQLHSLLCVWYDCLLGLELPDEKELRVRDATWTWCTTKCNWWCSKQYNTSI